MGSAIAIYFHRESYRPMIFVHFSTNSRCLMYAARLYTNIVINIDVPIDAEHVREDSGMYVYNK